MKVRIVALGHRMPGWVVAGCDDYARRLPREYAVGIVELKPAVRERGRSVAQMLAAEATRITAACAGFRMVALDERGEAWSTREFAARLRGFRDAGDDVAFVIGSADGLDRDLKTDADLLLSLSAMTLPHALVRVLLAEQLYRAVSLIQNHPYHRD